MHLICSSPDIRIHKDTCPYIRERVVNVYLCGSAPLRHESSHSRHSSQCDSQWTNSNPGLKITQIVERHRETLGLSRRKGPKRQSDGKRKEWFKEIKSPEEPRHLEQDGDLVLYSNFCHLSQRFGLTREDFFISLRGRSLVFVFISWLTANSQGSKVPI